MAKLVKCKTCGKEIAKSAKTCPYCGAKRKGHPVLGVFLAIFGIMLFMAGIGGAAGGSSASQEPNADPHPEYITNDEYDAIETGMTYEQVVEIVGGEGELTSESEVMGVVTKMVFWKADPYGANASVTFQDGKVFAKAKAGMD